MTDWKCLASNHITPNFICEKKLCYKRTVKNGCVQIYIFLTCVVILYWFFDICLNFFLHVSLDGIVNPKAFMNYDDMLIFLVDSPAFWLCMQTEHSIHFGGPINYVLNSSYKLFSGFHRFCSICFVWLIFSVCIFTTFTCTFNVLLFCRRKQSEWYIIHCSIFQ